MTSLDPQLPLQPLPPPVSQLELQHSEAQHSEQQRSEQQHSETDILQPIPFCPDDSALRPTAPSGLELHIWFAKLSLSKQVLTLLVAGLFLLALLGVVFQLLALAIQLLVFGLMAFLLLKFLTRPTPG